MVCYFVVHTIGYFGSQFVYVFIFPAFKRGLAHLNAVAKTLCESLFVFCFFSLWFPLWQRFLFRATTSILHQTCDGTTLDLAVQRCRTFNIFLCDLSIVVHGRGILFNLSSPWLFYLILIKDFIFPLWHWGFKSTDEFIILTLKNQHPEELKLQECAMRKWIRIVRGIEQLQRIFSIPYKLGMIYTVSLDFREIVTQCDYEPSKSRPIFIRFAGFCVQFSNIPARLSRSFTADICCSKPSFCSEAAERKNSLNLEQDEKKVGGEITIPSERSSERRRSSRKPSFEKIFGSAMESIQIAVTIEDKARLNSICEELRWINFHRFQSWITARFFSDILIIVVPFFLSFTNMQYSPGFVNPYHNFWYMVCGISYAASDFVCWFLITYCVFSNYVGFRENLIRYQTLLQTNDYLLFKAAVLLMIFFGWMLYKRKWYPFDELPCQTTYSDESCDMIYELCKLKF